MSPIRHQAAVATATLLLAAVMASPARSGTATYTVQSTTANTDDSHLREDNVDEHNGDKSELRLKATNDRHNRHAVVRMPLPTIGARTVLQAWLRMTVSGASSSQPIDSRIYPLQETWNELQVSWRERSKDVVWTAPGGTHDSRWSGRALPSSGNTGGQVSWSVGPIVSAWQRGVLPNYGFLVDADRGSPDREVIMRSTEYTSVPTATPQLVVYATDERPAIVDGSAEIQPRSLHLGGTADPLNVWLDVTASGSTPSGLATGFDTAILTHGGRIAATGLDGVWVNGLKQLGFLVTWYDNGTSVTVKFPRVTGNARVKVALRVRLLADPSSSPLEMPVLVDDSGTPGAWAQSVWPADADGTPGNGDDWLVAITNLPPVAIDLQPDTATVTSGLTLPLLTYGRDTQNNQFVVEPDSVQVVPAARGTATAALFTAGSPGNALLIARLGSYRDTSYVTVVPPRLPAMSQLSLQTRAGASTTTLLPGDTMRVALNVSDGDGFRDIAGLDVELSHAEDAGKADQPALRAEYQWRRGVSAGWSLADPAGSSWAVVSGLSTIDTTTNSTTSQAVALGFVAGRIARASSSGDWTIRVRVYSATPPDTSTFEFKNFDAAVRTTLTVTDTLGAFSSARPGATHLPLRVPAAGGIGVEVLSNANGSLLAAVDDMHGLSNPADTLFVEPPPHIAWSLGSGGSVAGWLGRSFATVDASVPAAASETPAKRTLYLWLDIPLGLAEQDYLGAVRFQMSDGVTSMTSDAQSKLLASVASVGQAATSAVAEVAPDQVDAGDPDAEFDVWFLPSFQAGDSGVDRLLVDLPEGWGTPVVTSVKISGLPVAAVDSSSAGMLKVALASRITAAQLVQIHCHMSAPVNLDSMGSGFPVQFDDSSTPTPPQAAVEGDANGESDGDDWIVRVVAGPPAALSISPDPALCYVDSVVTFSAVATDRLGHRTTAAVTWSVLDPIGTIDAAGVFSGHTTGTARVTARSGSVSDTAIVTVRPVRGVAVRAIETPPSAYQGQQSILVRVSVENIGVEDMSLDTLRVRFRRSSGAAADGDFTAVVSPPLPAMLPSGATTWVASEWRVADDAALGRITVDARAAGRAGGYALADEGADATAGFDVLTGGIIASALQSPSTVRPGAEAVALTLAFENRYPVQRRLESIALVNTTSGPGDLEQLDEEAGDVRVYRDDGDGVFDAKTDTLLLSTVAVGGGAQLAPLGASLASNATVRLFVTVRPTLAARDGDVLDWRIIDPSSARFDSTTVLRNFWPLDPPGGCAIDGLIAAQVDLISQGSGSVAAGIADQHVLSLRLPPNGYSTDVLEQLAVRNLGSARAGAELARLRAWADDGDLVFTTADRPLGALAWTGAQWQLSGLAETVTLAGLVVHYTADIVATAENGRTIRLSVPSGVYAGIGMRSGNSGPLDAPIENPLTTVVNTRDQLTFAGSLVAPTTAAPGAREVPLLQITSSNTYVAPRTVTSLVLTNDTRGPGTIAERDRELEVVTLRRDANGNGRLDDGTDPVVGVSSFQDGRVLFGGLDWTIPAGGSGSMFVTAHVALQDARDGDSLGVTLAGPSDVSALEPSVVLGAWPLSGGHAVVDGMVAAQSTLQAVPAATLAPGEGPVRALDFIVPRNGYTDDVLHSVRVVNVGSATAADFVELHLWRDGGDGQFTAGGDDVNLGAMSPVAGAWQSDSLVEPLGALGARIFVSVQVAASLVDSASVQLAIPVFGLGVGSGDDGPRDQPLIHPETMILSSSALVVSISTAPRSSTVGQLVQVRAVVRNAGGESIRAVRPDSPVVSGTASLTLLGGPVPDSLDLAPAQRDTFTWTYRADAAGNARFTTSVHGIGLSSGIERRSLETTSDQHQVHASVGTLAMLPVQSMPSTVHAGQDDVVPLSLTLTHPGGVDISNARVRSIVLRLEDQSGAGVVPADLVDRVVVSEGTNLYLIKTAIETTGADLALTLATPIIVTPEQPTTVSLRLDVRDATAVPTFRVVVASAASVDAEDAISGSPIVVSASPSYPLTSGVARLIAEATQLDVTANAGAEVRATRGADAVPMLGLALRSPGFSGVTSDVRVNAVRLRFEDSTGTAVARPHDRLTRIVLRSGPQTLADRTLVAADSAGALVWLNPPLSVPTNTDVPLLALGDLHSDSPLGRVRVLLDVPATTNAVDANTGASVPAAYTVPPAAGPWVTVEAAAQVLQARGEGRLPATVAIGRTDLLAIDATMRHPHAPGTARIRLESLRVRCRDEARTPLAPAAYLSGLRVRWNGADTAAVTSVTNSTAGVPVPLPELVLEAGDSARVEVAVDLNPAAPASQFELEIAASGIVATEFNTGAAIAIEPASGYELPLISGLTRILPAARDLAVGLTSAMPAALAGDGATVVAGTVRLSNDAAAGAGAITIDHLVVRGGDAASTALALGTAVSQISAWRGDTLWAQSAPLSPDSATATLVAAAPLVILPGAPVDLALRLATQAGPTPAALRLGLDAASIGVVQPSSGALAVTVRAAAGQTFPLWTETGNFSAANLSGSWSNFPNPFAAGREPTTFSYWLRMPARVTLRLWTLRNDEVRTLLDGVTRTAGLQQLDTWDGRNGRGDVVRNGVYVADLVVRYDDGSQERVLRKVAVLR